jgi:hypothetical protein
MGISQFVERHLWRLAGDGKGIICPKCQVVLGMGAAAQSGARRESGELRVKQARR